MAMQSSSISQILAVEKHLIYSSMFFGSSDRSHATCDMSLRHAGVCEKSASLKLLSSPRLGDDQGDFPRGLLLWRKVFPTEAIMTCSQFGSQDFAANNISSKGWVGTFLLIGNAVIFSKGWARWDANLVMQTGSIKPTKGKNHTT